MTERRTKLQLHQGFALAALGLVTTQVILGQLLLNSENSGAENHTLKTLHLVNAIAASGIYWTAAYMSITAPEIEDKGDKHSTDTVTIHKTLAWVHGTGMVISPFLGWYMTRKANSAETQGEVDKARKLRSIHQIVGYTTAGALFGAFAVMTF